MCALAQMYRRFGERHAGDSFYAAVALAIAASDDALNAIATLPPRSRKPALVVAALYSRALSGHARALADAFESDDGDAAAVSAVDLLMRQTDELRNLVARRAILSAETGRSAVLYPAVADVAHVAGTTKIGLISFGCTAGFDLDVDRVGIDYSDGTTLGVATSPVQ